HTDSLSQNVVAGASFASFHSFIPQRDEGEGLAESSSIAGAPGRENLRCRAARAENQPPGFLFHTFASFRFLVWLSRAALVGLRLNGSRCRSLADGFAAGPATGGSSE